MIQNGILTEQEVAVMRPTNAPQSLAILKDANAEQESQTVSRNFYLRKDQDDMLQRLAKYHGESKVTVLRFIIDEWRELKLREAAK
jgi:hypothetical protein